MCSQPRGVYDLACLDCCVRLVMTAHPNKRVAGALMAAIERHKGAPARADVVEAVRAAAAVIREPR